MHQNSAKEFIAMDMMNRDDATQLETEALDSQALLNALECCVLILDEQLTISYANPSAEQLFSMSQRRLLGLSFPSLLGYASLDVPLMHQTLSQGKHFIDNEVSLNLGKQHIVSLSAQPFAKGQILLELSSLDNQRQHHQDKYQYSQHLAARDLVRNLAHEIKNPLGGLRGAAQLLGQQLNAQPELQEYTQMIIEQADRLRHLVDHLLGPQKLGQSKTQNIHQAIEAVYPLIEMEKSDNIHLIRDYDPSLPDLPHDAEQLQQIILNLVRNALQAIDNKAGTVKIRTRSASQININGELHRTVARIDIEDDGPGIPEELQDTLFYPSVSGRESGSGLGLAITRSLMTQHKGKIECQSRPGKTLFSLYFPITQAMQTEGQR